MNLFGDILFLILIKLTLSHFHSSINSNLIDEISRRDDYMTSFDKSKVKSRSSNSKKPLHVDKSYELFKNVKVPVEDSEESGDDDDGRDNERVLFKLRCDFSSISFLRTSNLSFKNLVSWYKLDLDNFEYVKKFDHSLSESDDVFVQTYLDSKTLNASNSKLISELNIKINLNNSTSQLNPISGIYLCKLVLNNESSTLFQLHSYAQSQYIQKVSVNELIERDQDNYFSAFKLDYSIIKTTDSIVVIEFNSVDKSSRRYVDTMITSTFKLIYSLTNTDNQTPIMRGSIDLPTEWYSLNNSSALQTRKPLYLILEGLAANKNFTLVVFLKQLPNSNKLNPPALNYIKLLLNRTVCTLNTSSSLESFAEDDKLRSEDVEEEADYDYDEEEDADEYENISTPLENLNSGESSTPMLQNKSRIKRRNDRIISCDLKSSMYADLEDYSDYNEEKSLNIIQNVTSTSNSLFDSLIRKQQLKKKRRSNKSNFITINYSASNMAKSVANMSRFGSLKINELVANVSNIGDFFNVKQFNQNTFDYLVYFDCLKQYKNNQQASILTKPLCLFSPIATSSSSDIIEYYSIQTSFHMNHEKTSIYVSSACQKHGRFNRDGKTKPSLNKNNNILLSNVQSEQKNFKENFSSQFSSIIKRNETSIFHKINSNATMNAYHLTTSHRHSTSTSSSSITVRDCLLGDSLEFKLENFDINSPYSSSSPSSSNFIYLYQIEIAVPDSIDKANANSNAEASTKSIMRNINGFKRSHHIYNITLKKEKNSQVVSINLNKRKLKSKNNLMIIDDDEEKEKQEDVVNSDTLLDTKLIQEKEDESIIFKANSINSNNNIDSQVNNRLYIQAKDRVNENNYHPPLINIITTNTKNNNNNDLYEFKVKLISEEISSKRRKLTDETDLYVECKKLLTMNTEKSSNKIVKNEHSPIKDDLIHQNSSSLVGIVMTCLCGIVLIVVGFLFCLIMKKKYGFNIFGLASSSSLAASSATEYLRNLKRSILLKASANDSAGSSTTTTTTNRRHCKTNSKQSVESDEHCTEVATEMAIKYDDLKRGYQIKCSNMCTSEILSTTNMNKYFNYNYVRQKYQKWPQILNLKLSFKNKMMNNPNDFDHKQRDEANNEHLLHVRTDESGIKTNTSTKFRLTKYLSPKRYMFNKNEMQTRKARSKSYRSDCTNNSSSASSSPLILFSSKSTPASKQEALESEIFKKEASSYLVDTIRKHSLSLLNQTNNCDKLRELNSSSLGEFYNSTTSSSSVMKKSNKLKAAALNNNGPMIYQFYKEDNDSISVDLFDAYVQQMHVDGDFGFAQLYEEITTSTKGYSYSSDISLLECNRMKNRYSNILTYDHSRVKLSCDERDEFSSDYINANYVDGYLKPNAYIATQGPMPNTFTDFWKMILEKNCSIIVMITNVKEKGRIKCDQYWPDEGVEYYGNIQVTHLHTISMAFYTKRIFTCKIKNAKKRCNSERLVYQYHFTDWPDHGVPYYIMPVLTFIKKSSRSNPEFGGPIVVHCSAGVGRTGTYIVIDAMMRQAKQKSTVNIHTFLKHIRHQRNYLVQTEEQFIFIYDALLESLKSGETELNEHNYKSFINALERLCLTPEGTKLIDRQFQLITEYKPKDYQISCAKAPYNLEKNRSQNLIPVNNSRVVLTRRPGIDGSDYINASYLHGSSRQDEFIVTQYPTKETKYQFWQMVWDNNSSQIVVLNSDETESCELYWEPLGECMKCGDTFSVILREENFDMDFVLRDFLLQSIDEDYEFNCKMITACYWPDTCTPIKTSFDLINKVKFFRSNCTNSYQYSKHQAAQVANASSNHSNLAQPSAFTAQSPIIVHDLLGGFRAGTFCALYTFQDLIQMESSVNVYELAKMYHLKRPEIWSNRNNIMYLYEAVECLFEEMHLSNHFQFKNFLNSNIENHFNNMLNLTSNNQPNINNNLTKYQVNHLAHLNQQTQPIPNQHQLNVSSSITNSLTRLSVSNQQVAGVNMNGTLPSSTCSIINKTQRYSTANGTSLIGSRLYNFQNLKNDLISTDPKQADQSENFKTKTALIDIPRILPSFLQSYNSNSENNKDKRMRTTSQKAQKFMNTMKMKSAYLKKALFPQQSSMNLSLNNNINIPKNDKLESYESNELHQKNDNHQLPIILNSVLSASESNNSTSSTSSTSNPQLESSNSSTNLSSKHLMMNYTSPLLLPIPNQTISDQLITTDNHHVNIMLSNLNDNV